MHGCVNMKTDFLEPESQINTSTIDHDWICNRNTGHTHSRSKDGEEIIKKKLDFKSYNKFDC